MYASKEWMSQPERAQVKVTRLKAVGFGIRIWFDGRLVVETTAERKDQVGAVIASELRMMDKCGWSTPMTFASRHRQKNR